MKKKSIPGSLKAPNRDGAKGRMDVGLTDKVAELRGGLEEIDGSGTQSGSHPAKHQSKIMRFIG